VRLTLLATFAINATKVFISNLEFALRVQQTVTTVQILIPVLHVIMVFLEFYVISAMDKFQVSANAHLVH
jgi:hypothetical protein